MVKGGKRVVSYSKDVKCIFKGFKLLIASFESLCTNSDGVEHIKESKITLSKKKMLDLEKKKFKISNIQRQKKFDMRRERNKRYYESRKKLFDQHKSKRGSKDGPLGRFIKVFS
jgi:hypothetical protein